MAISQTIFRQYDVRGIVGTDLTDEVAYGLGRGYAAYLVAHGIKGAVAVGRDNRPSGNALRDALVRGLTECGVDVVDVGVVPTPLLYWTLHHEPVVGGIQITGSHNPPEYNGFKTSGQGVVPVGSNSGLVEIEAMARGARRFSHQADFKTLQRAPHQQHEAQHQRNHDRRADIEPPARHQQRQCGFRFEYNAIGHIEAGGVSPRAAHRLITAMNSARIIAVAPQMVTP